MSPTVTFNVAADGSDSQRVARGGSSYPPDGAINTGTDFNTFRDPTQVVNGLVRWDTSSLPDNIYVLSATARLCSAFPSSPDARQITMDWHSWAFTTADYSLDALSDAHAGTPISSLSHNTFTEYSLSNPDSHINRSGYTSLRVHVSGTTPTDSNGVYFYEPANATSEYWPELVVTYENLLGPTYVRLGADGAGKKERTQTQTVDTETVHVPYHINTDATTGNTAVVTNTYPSTTDYSLAVRQLEESVPSAVPRYTHTYRAVDLNNPGTTEALQTLTPVDDFVTGTAANNFTVPAGKVFRVQAFHLGMRIANTTSPALYGTAYLRVNTGGTVTTASPAIAAVSCFATKAAAVGVGDTHVLALSEGIDIPAGASFGVGLVSMAGVAARTQWDIVLVGYEFDI